MKKKIYFLITIFTFCISYSQNTILEFSNNFDVEYKIYKSEECILKKVSSFSDSTKSTPEGLAQSYFFCSNDDWNKSNYFNPNDYQSKKQSNYDAIKKLKNDKNWIKLLHKFSFKLNGNEICLIMFIAELDGIDFKFPTTITCIKINNNWYINNLTNQYKLNELLMTFKSFRMLQLIDGQKTINPIMNELINKTRTFDSFLDIEKLYTITNSWEYLGGEQKYFTNIKNNDCDNNNFFYTSKKVNFTSIFKSIKIKIFDKNDQKKNGNIIGELKQNVEKDSIYLKAKIDVDYNGKNYSIVKYNLVNLTGKFTSKIKILDSTLESSSKPISELIFLFKNLKTEIFFDLTPSNNDLEAQKKDSLFKKTRGNFDITNTSKLYELYKSNKSLFSKYLDN